jgi:FEZ-like protein
VSALTELTDELHRCIHDYSAELVGQLALRDELDFDKELKNQFIWLLLRVQKRRREAQLDVRPSPRHSRIIASGVSMSSIVYVHARHSTMYTSPT